VRAFFLTPIHLTPQFEVIVSIDPPLSFQGKHFGQAGLSQQAIDASTICTGHNLRP
jgi:hypothetical protein